MSQKPLLIVESPTKIKTIQQYLGNDYEVISCVGHVKDLPSKELGIDIDKDFEIKLVVLPDKEKFITDLRKKSKRADRVLIATDPDREGEAIAAHLASEVPEEKLERVQFTEITKAGIVEGMNNVRKIDQNLVNAQMARRVIDRLVGYKVSPVLWATLQSNMKFVTTTLSAGRVQSAAVKIIVDRDRLRVKFHRSTYFDLKAILNKDGVSNTFNATLIRVDGTKIASSNDFDSETGNLKNKGVLLLTESQADALVKELETGSCSLFSRFFNTTESISISVSPRMIANRASDLLASRIWAFMLRRSGSETTLKPARRNSLERDNVVDSPATSKQTK